jgi:2-polyprenyl-3-methyl-5-hydroxy-6-metoxy-1,4-benzoquinol methylase
MIASLLDRLYTIAPPRQQRTMVKLWYQYLYKHLTDDDVVCTNYGYCDAEDVTPIKELSDVDQIDHYGLALYHHIVRAVDLEGLAVLEVGCGRGGGASYIMRHQQPHAMIGVDLAAEAIRFCTRHYGIPGLSFSQGDAEALGFKSSGFDVVLSVESSHTYGVMEQFLAEVYRVLRPNGYLLLADHREKHRVERLRTQLRGAGFEVISEENITSQVMTALERANEPKLNLLRARSPRLLYTRLQQFAATQGTSTYEAFKGGTFEYVNFVLRK